MQEKPLLTTKPIYVQVALPIPVRKYFDYFIAADNINVNYPLQPGIRVQVPFGKRTLIGIIVNIVNTTTIPVAQLKPVLTIIDKTPIFSQNLQKLLIWASQYYQYPLGLVFDTALTTPLRNGKTSEQYLATTATTTTTATTAYNANSRASKNSPFIINNKLQLNPEQTTAVNTIVNHLASFKTFLLDGITGSGKTEVYLQLIEKTLQLNKQVLILIPEIGLTPQTLAQFSNRFTIPIAAFHSQISDKERTKIWLQAKLGNVPIIIGTRSAAFIPLLNPGLFIIDEEHDQSFKQQDGLRYSARDLLIKRAQLENCPIVLGSATPALESLWNAERQRYSHLKLPNRAGVATTPNIEILDIRHKKLHQGLSLLLLEKIATHIKNNEQVLIFLNRRGYAPVLMCSNCNFTKGCDHCDAKMILHFHPTPKLICHHCQTTAELPKICPNCQKNTLKPLGLGTEKLEHILQSYFPSANIVRVDKDVTRKKHAMQTILQEIISGKANILIGTQMLAKGHHFPNLSLVAIIDIDTAFFSTDFRTIEHIGQLITQVAGRAGRAELPGQVLLQTQYPEHPLLITLLTKGYHALTKLLLAERKLTMLPPFSYQILFKAASKKPTTALHFLTWLKQQGQDFNNIIKILGPIPAPIEKKASYFRAHLLLQATNRQAIHNICSNIIKKIEYYPNLRKIRWSVDVDPLDFY